MEPVRFGMKDGTTRGLGKDSTLESDEGKIFLTSCCSDNIYAFYFIHEGFWNQSFPSVALSDRQHYSEMLELIPAIWASPMGIKELTRIPSFYFHLVLSTRLRGESPFKGRLES